MVLRSPKTKDLYFQVMHTFLGWVDKPSVKTPDDLVKLPDPEVVDLVRKFSYKYEVEGKEKMAQMVKTVFKSFFSANNRELKSPHLRVHKVSRTKRTYNKIVPTKEQVYAMADAAGSLRDKAVVLTLWQSGLRNSTLRNLTVGDLKEGLLKGEPPLRIDITPDMDKKNLREPYYTFIDLDAVEAIKRYLATRGDLTKISEDEPLFLSNLKGGKRKPISDAAVRRAVKNSARNAGMDSKEI
jgi:integrase